MVKTDSDLRQDQHLQSDPLVVAGCINTALCTIKSGLGGRDSGLLFSIEMKAAHTHDFHQCFSLCLHSLIGIEQHLQCNQFVKCLRADDSSESFFTSLPFSPTFF